MDGAERPGSNLRCVKASLTETGAAYLPDVRRAFEDLSATTTKLFGQSRMTSVAVRAPVSFVTLWLAPRLPRFQAAYPGIEILIFLTIWADVQPDAAIDVDIRFGNGSWEGYEAERLWHKSSVIACRRDVAQRRSDKKRLAEIARTRDTKAMRVDNSVAAVLMAASSGGAAIVLRPFAERAVEMLPLHLPFGFELPVEQAHYLLTPMARAGLRPEALLFREWIIAAAKTP